jgi:DNA invertase Pin-like site-specific DNA recombinase
MVAVPVSTAKPIDIYARVSALKRNEDREPSTEGQVGVCRLRLADLGLPEGKVLVDPGRSAWNPAVKRPAWDELMDRLERGVSGGFIVFDLERFTRQPKDGERMIGVAATGLLVLDSESEYDLTTPNGKKAFRDAINAAAYYSDRLSTRAARGKKLKAMAGEPNGGHRPFGFEPDLITAREEEAAVLRDLTARLLAGETQDALVADLNERGITTSYGKPWRPAGLRKVLMRERNCGRIVYTDPKSGITSVVGHLPGKPILTEEDFDAVTALYTSRRRGRPNSWHYLCSGIAVCGVKGCGRTLEGRPRSNVKPYPDGEVRRQYWCPKGHGGCGRNTMDQRALDEAAGALAIEILADPSHADAIESTAREIESEASRLDLAIAEADSVAEALSDRLGRGELTLSRYDIAVRPLDERLAKLKAERAALGDTKSQRPQRASREHWQRRWDSAEPEDKRSLIKMALRGRRLVIAPPEPGTRAHEGDVTPRITIKPLDHDPAESAPSAD